LHELIGDRKIDLTKATVSYTLVMGYERIHIDDGGYHFHHEGALHPNDKCEGVNICIYCGELLRKEDTH